MYVLVCGKLGEDVGLGGQDVVNGAAATEHFFHAVQPYSRGELYRVPFPEIGKRTRCQLAAIVANDKFIYDFSSQRKRE